jgi:hypothetical protein
MTIYKSLAGLTGLFICATAATAGFIVAPYTGLPFDGAGNLNDVTVTLASAIPDPSLPSDIQVGDVRGTAFIVDSSTLSQALLFSGAQPVPNSLELGLNSTATQAALLIFDLTPGDFSFAGNSLTGQLTVSVTGSQFSSTLNDPALLALEGQLAFLFDYESALSSPERGVVVYGLSGIVATPEPSTGSLVMVAFALIALGVSRRGAPASRRAGSLRS